MAPKKYSHIDFKPNKTAQRNAARALEVRAEKPTSQRGMTSTGIARARDISNGVNLSPETWDEMRDWFARHEVDKSGKTWDEQGKGWQAWMGWGGDAAYAQARKIVRQMEAADRKDNAEGDFRLIPAFPNGPQMHPGGDFVVDDDFLDALDEFLSDMRVDGYYPPILMEHQADGHSYGIVHDLVRKPDMNYFSVEFADGMAEKYDKGYLSGWSPSFYEDFTAPHSGKTYKVALREHSAVSVPHMKNLPRSSPHYALSESGLVHRTENVMIEEEVEVKEGGGVVAAAEGGGSPGGDYKRSLQMMEKSLAEMRAMQDGTHDMLKKLMALLPQAEEVEVEVKPMEEMAAKVAAMEKENAEQAAKIAVLRDLSEKGIKADDDQMARLVKLHEVDATLYAEHVEAISKKAPAAPVRELSEQPEVGSGAAGVTVTAPTNERDRVLGALRMCNEEGVPAGYRQMARMRQLLGTDAAGIAKVYTDYKELF